ncbi:MAG: hypothetical protein IJ571_00985 [Ruminococcus sp.]|nr:hypothetical protein [Ruminococcus sp.]
MKKSIVIAAALLMMLSAAGCENKIEKSSSAAANSSASSKAASGSSAAQTDTGDDDIVIEHTTDGTLTDNVYDCSLYSFEIDKDKWLQQTGDDTIDCMFIYQKDNSYGSFNVISVSDDELADADIEDYGQMMIDTYSDQVNDISGETSELSGEKAYTLTFTQTQETDLKTVQILSIKGSNLYIVTYSAAVDSFDELSADAESILSTFTFK